MKRGQSSVERPLIAMIVMRAISLPHSREGRVGLGNETYIVERNA